MEKLEGHLNDIIKRQERLEKRIMLLLGALLGICITSALAHAFIYAHGDLANIFTGGVSAFIFSILSVGLYVIIRLHACMNGCDFIKIMLHEGGLDAAENTLNNNHCTKDIDTKKLKELATIGNL